MPRKDPTPGLARENIRAVNTRAVLSAIHRQGQVSRTDLAGQVGLSQAAVTEITAELVRSGLVFEARAGESEAVGRKPILLQIDYDSATVLGVKITNHFVTSVLTNLRTEVVATHLEPMVDHRPETVLDAIYASVGALADQTGSAGPLVAAAVTLPGIVDPGSDAHVYSALLGWHDVPIARLLEERLGVPVLLDNDVNALAAAEASFGLGRLHDSFLVVTLGRGVGLGIVMDGRVYRGPHGGAGEFGHITIDPAGPACTCGKHGCLEAWLSDAALLAQAREVLPEVADLDELTAMALAGNEAARDLFERAGTLLGRALSHLVNIFAPGLIILGGEGMRAFDLLIDPVRAEITVNSFGSLADRLTISIETWGDDAWARGAAGLAASRYLADVAWQLGSTRAAARQAAGR